MIGRGFFFRANVAQNPVLLGYDVSRAGTLGALLNIVRNGLAFGQRLETAALDPTVVDEDVFRTIGRRDEPKALVIAEPFNCTCSHIGYLC